MKSITKHTNISLLSDRFDEIRQELDGKHNPALGIMEKLARTIVEQVAEVCSDVLSDWEDDNDALHLHFKQVEMLAEMFLVKLSPLVLEDVIRSVKELTSVPTHN